MALTQQKYMKMKHNYITSSGAILFAGLLSAGTASAATHSSKDGMHTSTINTHNEHDGLPMLAPGVQELSLGGHLNWENSTAYNFNFSYGRFVTSNWLLGVEGGITGINSDRDYRGGVFAEYNFLTGTQWVPFIRSNVGYSHPDVGDSSALIGLDLGIKYFMRSNLAIYASFGGDWAISGDSNDDGFAKQIDLGLKFYF